MGDLRLIRSSIPDLLPMTDRPSGRHISAIIRSLCVSLGYWEDDGKREMPKNKMALGRALEHAIAHQMMIDQPDRYYRHWDDSCQYWKNDKKVKLAHDGHVYHGTVDLFDIRDWAIEEIKLSWLSSRYAADSTKLARFWWQLKAYCYMAGVMTGRLTVVFVTVNYNGGKKDIDAMTWEKEFTVEELERNWMMLMNHAAEMDWTKYEEGR